MKIAWGVNVRAVKIPTFNKTLLYILAIDQHVQREEQEDDDHSCSNLEDNFAEEKVFDNQESFRLAENKLYNKLVSCTTAPATNWGREGRRHISKNKYRI